MVVQIFPSRSYEIRIVTLLEIGEYVGIFPRIASRRVISDEVNRRQRKIRIDLPHDAAYAVPIIRRDMNVRGDPIKCADQKFSFRRDIKTHPLMADRRCLLFQQLLARAQIGCAGHLNGRKNHLRLTPMPPVLRVTKQCLSRRHMFCLYVGQILHKESTLPPGNHRRMVIGPSIPIARCLHIVPAGTHDLIILHSHSMTQASVLKADVHILTAMNPNSVFF